MNHHSNVYIVNKKGLFNFQILESIEAGIKLLGSEVKSIRDGRVELGESFVRILNEELYLVNAHIPAYQNADIKGYDPNRTRKLLVHKNQIHSLIGKLSKGQITLIPIAIYEKRNLIKVDVGVARSKTQIDKRKQIQKRDEQRRIEQEIRGKE